MVAPEDLLILGPPSAEIPQVPFEPVEGWDGSQAGAGRATLAAIQRAVELSEEGRIHGFVTGPAHKPALRDAGCPVPGHTELLQELTGAREVGMLMCSEGNDASPTLRVLLATTHLPLRDVVQAVTTERLVRQMELLHQALQSGWEIAEPRIALCALNPHASDGGLFGDEEARVMTPAVQELRNAGVSVTGPVPADTVFRRALDGEFHAVVAPYHDVGMAAFKSVTFGGGVNVTLGLPFPRTSPDHGTAFDQVGRGTARWESTYQALLLATRLARHRFDTLVQPG